MPMYPIADDPESPPLRTITLNEQWFSAIMGMFDLWTDRSYWDAMPDNDWIALEQRVITVMGLFEDANQLIIGLRVTNGVIEVNQNGVWVPTDSICDDCGDGGVPPLANQYAVSGNDRWCYAAWGLAAIASDRLEDLAQLADASFTFVTETTESITAFVLDIFTGTLAGIAVDPVANWLTNATTEPAIDYLRQNVKDDEAVEAAAELIYCAIKQAEELNDLDNIETYIQNQIPSNVQFIVNAITNDEFEVSNFGDVIDSVFNAGTDVMGAMIVAFWFAHEGIFSRVGLSEPIADTIRQLMAKAEFFDNRQCVGFQCVDNPCFILDFTQGTALSNYVLMEKGTWAQGQGIDAAVEFNSEASKWQSRISPQFVLDGVNPLSWYSVTWYFELTEPSALGNVAWQVFTGNPFDVIYSEEGSPQPDSPMTQVVEVTSALNFITPTTRAAFKDTEAEAIAQAYRLTKLQICADQATVDYMESRFQMIGI